MPQKDEAPVVSLELGGQTLAFPGAVGYVEPGMGFAVQFTALSSDDLARLKGLIAANAADAGAANAG